MSKKRCNRCYLVLPLDNFHKDSSKKDGLYTICKDCRAGKTQRIQLPRGWKMCKVCGEAKPGDGFYKTSIGERRTCIKCSEEKWNKSYIKKTNRVGNGGNLFTVLGASIRRSIWRSNPENKTKDRNSDKKYRASDAGLEKRREWKKSNQDYFSVYEEKRRSIKNSLDNSFTREDWHKTLRAFSFSCAYCGGDKNITQDHWIPLSRGGGYTIGNIVPACKSCNSRKKDKLPQGFCDKTTYLRIVSKLERLKND